MPTHELLLMSRNNGNMQQIPLYLVIFRSIWSSSSQPKATSVVLTTHNLPAVVVWENAVGLCTSGTSFFHPLLAWYSSQPSSWFLLADFSKRRILIPKYSHYFKNSSCKDKTNKHLKPEKKVFLSKHRNLILTETTGKKEKPRLCKLPSCNEKANVYCETSCILLYTLFLKHSRSHSGTIQPDRRLFVVLPTVTL